jgi:hypothetical protein
MPDQTMQPTIVLFLVFLAFLAALAVQFQFLVLLGGESFELKGE